MPDIYHRITINKPKADVYLALSTVRGLRGWWNAEADGDPTLGGQLVFPFDLLTIFMRVKESTLPSCVRWVCEGGPDEWIGTRFCFDISEDADGDAIVIFSHRGWWEETPFMGHCSLKWAYFLMSLKSYLEEGKGEPFPGDRQF